MGSTSSLLIIVLLFCCVPSPMFAQRGNDFSDFSNFAERAFGDFFGETDAERQALEAVEIEDEEERRIGDAALEDYLRRLRSQKTRVLTRGKDVEYLQALVSLLHPLMENADRYQAIRVYVANSKVTDARAFPGGSIVCMSGMIDFAESEAALVGVLAHELSHIDHGHQLRHIRTMRLAQEGFTSGAAMQRGMLMAKQFARPFRPEDETQADLDAARWMMELGYDPLEMAQLFHRLHERDQHGRNRAGSMRMPSFLRTHPYHADRYQAVKDLLTQMQAANRDRELYVGRENLRRRTPRSARQFEE